MLSFNSEQYLPHLSIDCVIFGYQSKALKVLVSKIAVEDQVYALTGGFIQKNESVDQAAHHIVEDRTGIRDIYLEQYQIFGEIDRSQNNQHAVSLVNRSNESEKEKQGIRNWFEQRFISIGFYALLDINNYQPEKSAFDESLEWYAIDQLPLMILDHNEMVAQALSSLRQNLNKNIIILNLLPETFTMKEIQDLYETIFGESYARNNFQRKILEMNVLERLEKKFTGAANKAPYLYRFKPTRN